MIQINPLKSYIDGGVRAAITTPPSASLVFDLPGKAIWVKGVKLKGTDHTYTFSHDNYITLANTPDSNESEDIKIGVNTSALKSAIDTTYGVVSTTANGLAPKFTSGNKQAATAATTYYFLGWTGTTLKWYQAPFRNIRINSETTDRLGVNSTDPLIISSGNGISVTWDSTNKKIIITNTKPDVNHNTDTKVAQSVTTQNKNYAVILKGNDSDEGSITTVNFSTYLKFNPSTKQLISDGEYYANGNQRLAHISEIPTSLKNPYALTISLNGTSQGPYDGSAAKNINITPGSIGAAISNHNHDGRYLALSGGWMSGDINFGGDNKIHWGRNTDSASISFKNDGDGDADSYMSFVTSDNGNEYFRWSHSSGSTNIEWMALRSDGLRVGGTKVSLEGHSHNDLYYTKTEVNNKLNGKSDTSHTHDDRYLKLTGGTMSGTIYRNSGGATINGRDHAIIRQTYAPGGSSWNPIACVDTETGTWTLGHLSSGDSDTNFHFCFSTNADYNAGNNNGNYVTLRNKIGTIALLSEIPDKNSWNYDDRYLKLTGGTMNGNARIGHGSGNLYIGNSGNDGWVAVQDICSQNSIGDGKWSIRVDGTASFQSIKFSSNRLIAQVSSGSNSPLKGIKLPYLENNGIGIFSRVGNDSDEGGIVLSEDTCVIYNSFDTGWGLSVRDKDINQTDISGDNTIAFGIRQDYRAYSLGGFEKSGSDNSYVLLGGGGHKAENLLNVASASVASKVYGQVGDTGTHELVRCDMNNDQFRIIAGSSGNNNGWAEIATADDGNEPIYVRQYTGVFSSVKRTLTLLDANGYAHFPSYINIGGNENNNSSPDRVWGSNGSDSYLRSYRTSALNVNYASSAGNADTVDGYYSSSFLTKHTREGAYNIDHLTDFVTRDLQPKSEINIEGTKPYDGWGIVTVLKTDNGTAQLVFDGRSNFYFRSSYGTENRYVTSGWKQVANLNSNVASATKLQTARTIWGQSFDGTGDIPINVAAKMPLVFFKRFDNNENAGYVGCGSSSNNNIYISSYVNANIILDGNNIGIGTYSPTYKLHVAGDIYTTTGFKKNGSSDSYVLLGGGGHQTISSLSVNYASSAGNADALDGLHAADLVRFYLSPLDTGASASSAKSWFTNTMPSGTGGIIYNVPGSEKTIIAGKSTGAYGHLLQLNYDDTYLRILRYYNGSWKSTDWEKISAGYADSSGNASSATKLTSSAGSATLPIYFSDGKPVACTMSTGNGTGIVRSFGRGAYTSANQYFGNGTIVTIDPKGTGCISANDTILSLGDLSIRNTQLLVAYDRDGVYYRRITDGLSYGDWKRLAFTTDTVANSDTCDGLHVHGGRNNEANKIVRTDGSGYLQVGYINSSNGDEGNNSSPARVWGTNGSDSYMRTYLTSALSVKYAASAGNADTTDGLHLYTRSLGVNGTSWTFASTANANSTTNIYAATSAGTSGQILKSTGGTPTWINQSDISAGYATYLNVQYCRDDDQPSNKGLWNTIKNGTTNAITNRVRFYTIYGTTTALGAPVNGFGELLEICSYNINHWQPQLWFGSGKDGRLYYRNKNYNNNSWGAWRTVAWTSDIPTVTNYYWANVKISASSSTSTSPTFSTCYANNWFRSYGQTGWYNETYSGGWYMNDTTWIRTWNKKGIYIDTGTIYNLGHAYFACNSGYNVGIGTTTPSYKLHVVGESYTSIWSRAGSGFYCEGSGVHFTRHSSATSVGEIDMTSNNEFCWGASTGTLYFNYRGVSRGKTVTNYIWNAGSSSSYASHTMGHITLGGSSYQIKRVGYNVSWINGRNSAIVRQTSASGYSTIISSKTASGSWEIGNYTNNGENLYFTYITDSNYNSGNNTFSGQVYFDSGSSVYATHFYEKSDIRYKKILKNLSINSNTIATLPLFDFEWIENNTIGTGTSAQAVQQILPNIVSGTDKLTLDYGVLGTIAGITACKELVTQKSELQQLKEKVKQLEDKLRKYENI